MAFGKPMVVWIVMWFDLGMQSASMAADWTVNLRSIAKGRQNTVAVSNKFDHEYLRLRTGLDAMLIPPLNQYNEVVHDPEVAQHSFSVHMKHGVLRQALKDRNRQLQGGGYDLRFWWQSPSKKESYAAYCETLETFRATLKAMLQCKAVIYFPYAAYRSIMPTDDDDGYNTTT